MLENAIDIGADISAHIEMMAQLGMPNCEIIRATQHLEHCYAGCYAKALNKAKARCWNRTDSNQHAYVKAMR